MARKRRTGCSNAATIIVIDDPRNLKAGDVCLVDHNASLRRWSERDQSPALANNGTAQCTVYGIHVPQIATGHDLYFPDKLMQDYGKAKGLFRGAYLLTTRVI